MIKKVLLTLSLMLIFPAFAGEYEDAMNNNNYVFLYLYTSSCGCCSKFNPNYRRISSVYGNKCKFLKIDASSREGYMLMSAFGAGYVPYVLLSNNVSKNIVQILPDCLLSYECIDSVVKNFIK